MNFSADDEDTEDCGSGKGGIHSLPNVVSGVGDVPPASELPRGLLVPMQGSRDSDRDLGS